MSSFYQNLRDGKITEIEESDTVSDGTAGNVETDTITFPLC